MPVHRATPARSPRRCISNASLPRAGVVHLDTYSWNDGERPGRPRGGEAQGLRAMFALLQGRYAH